ncbi:hypothetical protein [Rhizobium sp. OAE497]|uniref:hypothetical protein n=1 Tax=Rhizobium sp. OAE497 TaxID=2663796 RepID=UPI0018F5AD8F
MPQLANTIWADGPGGSPTQPNKADVREWGTWLESFITAIGANSGSVFATRAALYADLAHVANSMAWVVNDSTAAYNGIYQKSGASGVGAWAKIADLPYSFITAVDAGAGTPNAIVATSTLPISTSALVIMNVFEANTASPVTVAFNGGTVLTVKTNTGNDVSAGGLVAGMQLLGVVSGSVFRLVSDQVSSAVVAAAEAAASAANDSMEAAAQSAQDAADSAEQAASVVTGNIAAAIHAATAKSVPVDADELGLVDSAASWALKKLTWLAVRLGVFVQAAATVASAATADIGSASSFFISVTGTTAITSLGSAVGIQVGTLRLVQFAASLTLTNNANIILPTGANITTAANDFMLARYEGSGVWRVIWYRGALTTADWTTGTSTKPGMPTPAQLKAAIQANRSIAVVADVKAQGTAPQTLTAAAWTQRNLNTEVYDPDSIVSISGNTFTVTKDCMLSGWCASTNNQAAMRSRVYCVTDAAPVGYSAYMSINGSGASAVVMAFDGIKLDAGKNYRIETYHSSAAPAGVAQNLAGIAETYLQLKLETI